ncbi:(d)CMP kinase [Cellulosilyticum ruminicola]|uniref:(d)CMP kinase n=1 Tax=Cellulosilyticum ruminicola TaxID=425254 RepID=UPI0006D167EA|nr:(d)CMP kinase [Cellulosilyticum ruminicola]
MKKFSIAIDGPAGAGKSSIAKILANKLGCIYIDTGAMYRSVGLGAIKQGLNYQDEEAVSLLMPDLDIKLKMSEEGQQIFLNGHNVSTEIRNDEVAAAASKVATYTKVREALVESQRTIQNETSVVMDGRDIGTVVMPNATLKIYLTASVNERALRRFKEYEAKGIAVDLAVLTEEIVARDKQDMERKISPLKKSDDAVEIDTTYMTIEEIVERIISLLNERM